MSWGIHFVVPGDCVAQPRHSIGKVSKGRRAGRPVAYIPDAHPVHAFKQDVSLKAREAVRDCVGFPRDLPSVPLRLICVFRMPKLKKHKGGEWHFQRPDLDNLVKSVKDAMTGIVYADDSLVCREELVKVYAVGVPSVTVFIAPAGEAAAAIAAVEGVFDEAHK